MSLACILNLHVSLFPVVCQLEQLLSVMNVSKTGAYCIFFLAEHKENKSWNVLHRCRKGPWRKMEENDRHVTFSCCLKKQCFGGLFPLVELYASLITNIHRLQVKRRNHSSKWLGLIRNGIKKLWLDIRMPLPTILMTTNHFGCQCEACQWISNKPTHWNRK